MGEEIGISPWREVAVGSGVLHRLSHAVQQQQHDATLGMLETCWLLQILRWTLCVCAVLLLILE